MTVWFPSAMPQRYTKLKHLWSIWLWFSYPRPRDYQEIQAHHYRVFQACPLPWNRVSRPIWILWRTPECAKLLGRDSRTCPPGLLKKNVLSPSPIVFCLILTVTKPVTRKVLLAAMIDFVASVDYVDSIYSVNEIPSLQQYWCRRDRTAGVYPVIATIPYVDINIVSSRGWQLRSFIYGFDVSGRDLDDTNMRLLQKHTSYLVHTWVQANIVLSFC